MVASVRPRRSVLYIPGSNARALVKARNIPVDALILDLEDAVAPAAKEAARAAVRDALEADGYGRRERAVRVNGLDTPWGRDDLVAVAGMRADAILIPKVGSAEQLRSVVSALELLRAPESLSVWAMMETVAGVLNAAAIAAAHRRLACIVMGTNDLAKELRVPLTPERLPLQLSLQSCVLASRANGVACVDGAYNAFRDLEGFRASCLQGRELGFDGKSLIHPGQAPIANEVFGPSEDELDLARRQIEEFERTVREGRGVAVVDGQIVENLHVENARRLLAEAESVRALEAELAHGASPGETGRERQVPA